MGKDKKILLYRIDEQAKSVIFVVTEDNESVWGKISEDAYTVISFDDVFRDITEFRSIFLTMNSSQMSLSELSTAEARCSVRYWNDLMITA